MKNSSAFSPKGRTQSAMSGKRQCINLFLSRKHDKHIEAEKVGLLLQLQNLELEREEIIELFTKENQEDSNKNLEKLILQKKAALRRLRNKRYRLRKEFLKISQIHSKIVEELNPIINESSNCLEPLEVKPIMY